jgi:hypothetical protein
MTPRERYTAAHRNWFLENHKSELAQKYIPHQDMPPIKTANGLTKFILNFLFWSGCRATRVNVIGRKLKNGKRIPSATRKGSSDISATIRGKSVMIEIKVGRDTPSPDQLLEQQREQNAGGVYEFIKTPEDFLQLYDFIVSL